MAGLSIKRFLLIILILLFFITPGYTAIAGILNNTSNLNDTTSYESFYSEASTHVSSNNDQNSVSIDTSEMTQKGCQGVNNPKASDEEILELFDIQELRNNYRDKIRFSGNSDGTTTAEFYIKPSYYWDEDLGQQLIDTTIVYSGMNDYQYHCEKNNLKVQFRKQYSPCFDSNLVYLNDDTCQYPVTWQPYGLSIEQDLSNQIKNNDKEVPECAVITFKSTPGMLDKNKIVYENIYPGCEDQYTIFPNRLKHDIILEQNPLELKISGPNGFLDPESMNLDEYSLNYYGILTLPTTLEPYVKNVLQEGAFEPEPDNTIEFRSKAGETVYEISPAIAFEQIAPKDIIQCQYKIIPLGKHEPLITTDYVSDDEYIGADEYYNRQKLLVVLSTDLAWLLDLQRHYPVVIDPSIILQHGTLGEVGYDAYLVKGNETEPGWTDYNFGQSQDLKVSIAGPSIYSNEHLYQRSILKFPGIDTIDPYAQIEEAKLTLQSKTPDGSMSIAIFNLFDNWLEGNGTEAKPSNVGATWRSSGYNIWSGGNYDGYKSEPDIVLVSDYPFYRWDITDIVQDWVRNPGTNFGLLLTGIDDEDVIKVFHSSDTPSVSVRPKLTINYNTPPRSTGLNKIIVHEDIPEKIQIKMEDIFFDPDESDILEFQLMNTSGKFVKTGFNNTKNVSVELRSDKILYIEPAGFERYGEDIITVRVRDHEKYSWLELTITVIVLESNDPPKFESIGGQTIYWSKEWSKYYVNLEADEETYSDYTILIEDPDNTEFLENETVMDPEFWEGKEFRNDSFPGDLEFRWEKEKTNRFTISERENFAKIGFNPDNSLVGTFFMNVTVYDTVWYKPSYYPKPKKLELSNNTVVIIFTIHNTNDPPNIPKIVEPLLGAEFSTDDFITFIGVGDDPDLHVPGSTEELRLMWHSSLDGNFGIGPTIKIRLSKGKHLITLTVEDFVHETNFVNVTINVRNRATIDAANCSHYFEDDTNDVICYFYSISDEGGETFFVVRDGSYPEFNVFIDIIELTSVRVGNYLFLNLTVSEDLALIQDSKNYKYVFNIYLVRPTHQEEIKEITSIGYDARRFDDLHKPKSNEYYARFGLNDGEIINDGKTLFVKAHLGDLETGEETNSELKSDFSVFATMKVEIKQHPEDSFEHIICYDSIGLGAEEAPDPEKKTTKPASDQELDLNVTIPAVILIVIILIIIFYGLVLINREGSKLRKSKAEKEEAATGSSKVTPTQTQLSGPPLTMPPPGMPVPPQYHPGAGGMGGIGIPPQMLPPPMTPMQIDNSKKKKKWGKKKR